MADYRDTETAYWLNTNKSFADAVIDGTAKFEDIDIWIEAWHDDPTIVVPLHTYLGLTWSEYQQWGDTVFGDEKLKSIIAYRAAGRVGNA